MARESAIIRQCPPVEVAWTTSYPMKTVASDKNGAPLFFETNLSPQNSYAEFRNTLLRDSTGGQRTTPVLKHRAIIESSLRDCRFVNANVLSKRAAQKKRK